jgi:hypothetical protein
MNLSILALVRRLEAMRPGTELRLFRHPDAPNNCCAAIVRPVPVVLVGRSPPPARLDRVAVDTDFLKATERLEAMLLEEETG